MARVCGGENVGPRILKAQLRPCTAFQATLISVSLFGNLGQEINPKAFFFFFLAWHLRTCEERLQRKCFIGWALGDGFLVLYKHCGASWFHKGRLQSRVWERPAHGIPFELCGGIVDRMFGHAGSLQISRSPA